MAIAGFNAKILKLLRDAQYIDADQFKDVEAQLEQLGEKASVDQVLLENDFISEDIYICTVADAANLPPINLDKVHPLPELKDQIPEDLIEYHHAFPVSKIGNSLTVAVANPFDVISHDDFKVIVGLELKKAVTTVAAIARIQKRFYHAEDLKVQEFLNEFKEDDGDIELRDRKKEEEDADLTEVESAGSVIDVINKILIDSTRKKCSDIHFEPMENHIRVRVRIDGVLGELAVIPKRFTKNLVSRIKVMTSEMDISERRMPQDGSFRVRIEGRPIDFRVSSLPTVRGEKIAMRILDKEILNYSLAELGFEPMILDGINWAIHQPYGMILCNGPTACGKTTTLYACISDINDIKENISTVEEPVEYEVYGINQVNVQADQGRTFAAALRSLLRQDPDTILIGEIRDTETIDIAVKAALTGHRVFSTLHTNDAAGTIQRILSLGVEPFLVGSSLLAILSQRLPRRLCERCKAPLPRPEKAALIHFGFTEEQAEDTSYDIFKAVGCDSCNGGGYKGRFATCELLKVDEEIARMIIAGENAFRIKAAAVKRGMHTLRDSGVAAIIRGATTFEEIKKVSGVD